MVSPSKTVSIWRWLNRKENLQHWGQFCLFGPVLNHVNAGVHMYFLKIHLHVIWCSKPWYSILACSTWAIVTFLCLSTSVSLPFTLSNDISSGTIMATRYQMLKNHFPWDQLSDFFVFSLEYFSMNCLSNSNKEFDFVKKNMDVRGCGYFPYCMAIWKKCWFSLQALLVKLNTIAWTIFDQGT